MPAKVSGWSWLKERVAEVVTKYKDNKKSTEQLRDDDYDYYELFGIAKVSEQVHDDHYYQELLGIKKMPMVGSLNNKRTREWYLYYLEKIPEAVDKNLSLEAQAMQAFQLRNWLRKKARELMVCRELAVQLEENEPNLSWEQVRQKQRERGLYNELASEGVIRGSSRSREEVNDFCGVKKPCTKEIDPLLAPYVKTSVRVDESFESTFVSKEELPDGKLPLKEFVKLSRINNNKKARLADKPREQKRESKVLDVKM